METFKSILSGINVVSTIIAFAMIITFMEYSKLIEKGIQKCKSLSSIS